LKTLARVTGTIFIILGLLAVGFGIYEMVRGFTRPEPFMPALFGAAEAEGLLLPLRMVFGWVVSIQGLMLAALGEGLWLVTTIADEGRMSRELLAKLVARGQFTIP
jgi:hypothetical protein